MAETTEAKVRFTLGMLVATPAAVEAFTVAGISAIEYLTRHQRGDWGEVDAHDRRVNERSLKTGERLLSAYRLPTGVRIWIITDASATGHPTERQVTTVLLPEDY